MPADKPPKKSSSPAPGEVGASELAPGESGALRIGATDQGMVRLILTTRAEVAELDFSPEDAREIAEEILAAANLAEGGAPAQGKRGRN